jgi:hypothetical protein
LSFEKREATLHYCETINLKADIWEEEDKEEEEEKEDS